MSIKKPGLNLYLGLITILALVIHNHTIMLWVMWLNNTDVALNVPQLDLSPPLLIQQPDVHLQHNRPTQLSHMSSSTGCWPHWITCIPFSFNYSSVFCCIWARKRSDKVSLFHSYSNSSPWSGWANSVKELNTGTNTSRIWNSISARLDLGSYYNKTKGPCSWFLYSSHSSQSPHYGSCW